MWPRPLAIRPFRGNRSGLRGLYSCPARHAARSLRFLVLPSDTPPPTTCGPSAFAVASTRPPDDPDSPWMSRLAAPRRRNGRILRAVVRLRLLPTRLATTQLLQLHVSRLHIGGLHCDKTWTIIPHPREHALGATTAALLAYVALHAGIGLLFLLSNLMRLAGGFVSPRRLIDLRLTRIWIDYTAVTGALAIGLVLALPALVGMLGMRP